MLQFTGSAETSVLGDPKPLCICFDQSLPDYVLMICVSLTEVSWENWIYLEFWESRKEVLVVDGILEKH